MFVNQLYAIIKYVSDAKKIVSEIGIKIELGPNFDFLAQSLSCNRTDTQCHRYLIPLSLWSGLRVCFGWLDVRPREKL